ncbi:MAG: thiD [Rickettsiaceae bacterium]|jgi:hydroxymethylpyrimidine/phosphomethylpyrimidine kinase|nr:thiD [Rickettsiaceae bacterium]
MQGRVLVVAGSDSGGGAGIQADIKTITMLGGYAATAITALTAQNTQGVFGIMEVFPDFVKQQMELVLSDIGADVVKTGMLHNARVINAVANVLDSYRDIPLVLDPVMVATSGDLLQESDAVEALKSLLLPKATLVTPNIPEAEILSGQKIDRVLDMFFAAEKILESGAAAVLVKGGHGHSDVVSDILMSHDGYKEIFESDRINTTNTHGTGCTLASAIACGLAQGKPLRDSIITAKEYVLEGIKTSQGFGKGHSALNHNVRVRAA